MKKLIVLILLISSYCHAQTVKIYFTSSNAKLSEIVLDYDISYTNVNQDMYIALIEDEQISDFIKESGSTLIGSFDREGNQYGVTKQLVEVAKFNDQGVEISKVKYADTGKAKHTFKSTIYINKMPDIKTYDIDGKQLSSTKPTQVKEVSNFAGWENSNFPKEEKIEKNIDSGINIIRK